MKTAASGFIALLTLVGVIAGCRTVMEKSGITEDQRRSDTSDCAAFARERVDEYKKSTTSTGGTGGTTGLLSSTMARTMADGVWERHFNECMKQRGYTATTKLKRLY